MSVIKFKSVQKLRVGTIQVDYFDQLSPETKKIARKPKLSKALKKIIFESIGRFGSTEAEQYRLTKKQLHLSLEEHHQPNSINSSR